MKRRSLKQWVESIHPRGNVLIIDRWAAKIDAPGWFSGQWFDIPADVRITPEQRVAYRGLPGLVLR